MTVMEGSMGSRGHDSSKKKQQDKGRAYSRRGLLAASAAFVVGGGVGAAVGAHAFPVTAPVPDAPPLPWKWVELDPLDAGRRAYRLYFDPVRGGCGSGSYLGILSLLKEKVGYPWTTLPDMLMSHAAAGYGGHGTLCGSLGGASCIINLVAYGLGEKGQIFRQMIDRLFYWYAIQDFPTDRFDDISAMPGQIRVKAMSPLCHTSVSKWALAAGEEVTSKAKKERCAKVCGECVYIVVHAMNEYFAGRWTPPRWEPSEGIKHCIECHGPDDMWHTKPSLNHQQGHMECLMCHDDHTLDDPIDEDQNR
jgi:hypothetical protein